MGTAISDLIGELSPLPGIDPHVQVEPVVLSGAGLAEAAQAPDDAVRVAAHEVDGDEVSSPLQLRA